MVKYPLFMIKLIFLTTALGLITFATLTINDQSGKDNKSPQAIQEVLSSSNGDTLKKPTPSRTISQKLHVFQSFNNCGPAVLAMAFSYYGIEESQEQLGNTLRPYQNPQGINDDKSVTLDELAEKAKGYNLTPFHRPNGNIELLKNFIFNGIPVITRTWLNDNEDIGHYRLVRGYNDSTQEIIQDDSLQGENLKYSYELFTALWKKFNFEYLVLVPKDKLPLAEEILRDDMDVDRSWEKALRQAQVELQVNPEDITARFNLSVALYHTGDYKKSIEEFEKIENQLSFRTLWYQIEPILAYFKIKNYERVLSLTESVFSNGNLGYSELYFLRSEIYKAQGDNNASKIEREKADSYNPGMSYLINIR